jgi:hypothetical protein
MSLTKIAAVAVILASTDFVAGHGAMVSSCHRERVRREYQLIFFRFIAFAGLPAAAIGTQPDSG